MRQGMAQNKCPIWRNLLAAVIAAIALSFALTTCDNSDSGTTTVPVTGVTLDQNNLSMTIGGTATLAATVAPDNATNKAVTWSTSDPAKATVANGTVTAVAAGSATITVTTKDGNKTDSCSVTVTGGGTIGGKTLVSIAVTTQPTKNNTLSAKQHWTRREW